MSGESSHQRRVVRYYGNVQGVGFRYTSVRLAAHLPVTGYVKNLPDGSVQLVAEGQTHDLDRLLAAIGDELGRHIRSVQVTPGVATGEFAGFEVRR